MLVALLHTPAPIARRCERRWHPALRRSTSEGRSRRCRGRARRGECAAARVARCRAFAGADGFWRSPRPVDPVDLSTGVTGRITDVVHSAMGPRPMPAIESELEPESPPAPKRTHGHELQPALRLVREYLYEAARSCDPERKVAGRFLLVSDSAVPAIMGRADMLRSGRGADAVSEAGRRTVRLSCRRSERRCSRGREGPRARRRGPSGYRAATSYGVRTVEWSATGMPSPSSRSSWFPPTIAAS
jgi:hypothetical protein